MLKLPRRPRPASVWRVSRRIARYRPGSIARPRWRPPRFPLSTKKARGVTVTPPSELRRLRPSRLKRHDRGNRDWKPSRRPFERQDVLAGRALAMPRPCVHQFAPPRGRAKSEYTAHGFRSSVRDWAGNETSFPRELAEAALAHAVGDETERAYRRSDALSPARSDGGARA